jgi:hypothetical protein
MAYLVPVGNKSLTKPFQINFVKTLCFKALKVWVTTQSMACTVFCYVDNGTMGFNPTQSMDVYLHFPVFKLSCVNRSLLTGQTNFKDKFPIARLENFEKRIPVALLTCKGHWIAWNEMSNGRWYTAYLQILPLKLQSEKLITKNRLLIQKWIYQTKNLFL